MELRHIRYFLAVAQEMNFTKAADKLCIAQPPLSRQIKELEEELGVELFDRKPRTLALTEEGELFRQYATRVMELVNKSCEDVRDMSKGLTGTLYLASVEGHAPKLFADWIAGFHRENPYVSYSLWNGNSDDVANRLRKGLCELAIIMEPYNAEGVNAIHVYNEPWIAMMPQDHPLSKLEGDTVTVEQLVDYEMIIPSRESRLNEISAWFKDTGKTPVFRCRIAHMLNAYELTRDGVGVTIFPASANIGTDSSIVIKKIEGTTTAASYILVWSKERELSKAAQKFIEWVEAFISE